ncbi:hypothetical protein EJB05_00030, partial [Eragrostis curvula]
MEHFGDDNIPVHDHEAFRWLDAWPVAASILVTWLTVRRHIPFDVEDHIAAAVRAVFSSVSPYVTVTIDEHDADTLGRSEAYRAAESYLSATCAAHRARRLRAEVADGGGGDRVTLAVGDNEEVVDEFGGATMWWRKTKTSHYASSFWDPREEERRAYHLSFHRRHRDLVQAAYLPHVLAGGRAAAVRNRQRRLFTNNAGGGREDSLWSHVKLEHPSTFDKLAMDPARKREIVEDLEMFRDGKEYYASVGKAWKRGYLLFGPPGTGKSTMIAAMANFLDYDVYDLELTAVNTNTELRRLFIETTAKSIIVIEDIDCSVDLTAKRRKEYDDNNKKKKNKMPPSTIGEPNDEEQSSSSKVTLSGLLNFIDGLWSACGGERIIVFTTNHVDKLDPALIRRGRMDMRIEMSYCTFEAFKVLAKNYLHIHDHELFGDIRRLLEEVDMTPADVAENLMPRSSNRDVHASLGKLVAALSKAKKEAALAKALPPGSNDMEQDGDDDDRSDEEEDGNSNKKGDKE